MWDEIRSTGKSQSVVCPSDRDAGKNDGKAYKHNEYDVQVAHGENCPVHMEMTNFT